jgi:hypothetical protein
MTRVQSHSGRPGRASVVDEGRQQSRLADTTRPVDVQHGEGRFGRQRGAA